MVLRHLLHGYPLAPRLRRSITSIVERDVAIVAACATGGHPRDAAHTVAGQAELELLLKQMEHLENRSPGVPFDLSALRLAVRMDPA